MSSISQLDSIVTAYSRRLKMGSPRAYQGAAVCVCAVVSKPLPPESPFFPPYTLRGGWSEGCWSDQAWKEAVGAKCYVFPLRDCGRLIADLTALQPWSGQMLFQWIGEGFQLRLCGPVDRVLVQPLIARATETMAQFRGQQWCPVTEQFARQTWLASKHYGEGANALNVLVRKRRRRWRG